MLSRPSSSEQVNNHKAARTKSEALLAGRIFDDRGNRMTPSHARKGGIKYRYYLSSALLQGAAERAGSVRRIPAAEVEALVVKSVREHLKSIRADRRSQPRPTLMLRASRSSRTSWSSNSPSIRCRFSAERKTAASFEVPWQKTPSTRRREILLPAGGPRRNRFVRSVPRTAQPWSHRLPGDAVGSMNLSLIQRRTPKASPNERAAASAR